MKIHTVEQNGKGFHSFSRLMTFDNSNNGTNGTENLTPGKFGPGQFGPGKFGPFGPFGGFGNEFLENDFDEEEDDTKKKGKVRHLLHLNDVSCQFGLSPCNITVYLARHRDFD